MRARRRATAFRCRSPQEVDMHQDRVSYLVRDTGCSRTAVRACVAPHPPTPVHDTVIQLSQPTPRAITEGKEALAAVQPLCVCVCGSCKTHPYATVSSSLGGHVTDRPCGGGWVLCEAAMAGGGAGVDWETTGACICDSKVACSFTCVAMSLDWIVTTLSACSGAGWVHR
jgi:hypothetical protein